MVKTMRKTLITYSCDKCGDTVQCPVSIENINTGHNDLGEPTFKTMDFCINCAELIIMDLLIDAKSYEELNGWIRNNTK